MNSLQHTHTITHTHTPHTHTRTHTHTYTHTHIHKDKSVACMHVPHVQMVARAFGSLSQSRPCRPALTHCELRTCFASPHTHTHAHTTPHPTMSSALPLWLWVATPAAAAAVAIGAFRHYSSPPALTLRFPLASSKVCGAHKKPLGTSCGRFIAR